MESPFPAYKGDAPYIFVSYSHEDTDEVYPELQWLSNQGFNIWYDEGINPGSEWHQELADSIDGAALFLYFITPRSAASKHCQREVHYAIDHKKQLLAVHLEETALPSGLSLSLSAIQAILAHDLSSHDYRLKLLKGTSDHIHRGIAQVASAPTTRQGAKPLITLVIGVACLLVGVLVTAGVMWGMGSDAPVQERTLKRFLVELEPGDPAGVGQSLAITSNGNRILFTGQGDSGRQIFLRNMNELDAVPIRGTESPTGQEGAGSFALSPDDEWVVFNSPHDLTMKKVRLGGGTPVTLTTVKDSGQRGLDWGLNDLIVITPSSYPGLTQVSARGGAATPLTKPDGGIDDSDPFFLPDGKKLLFTRGVYGKVSATEVSLLDLASGEVKTLTEGAYARVTTSGHLLFLREGAMWAAALDMESGELLSEAVPVVEGVARYGVSDEGTLIYWGMEVSIGFGAPMSTLVWLDRDGNEETVTIAADRYLAPSISPDGKRIAVLVATTRGVRDLWVYTLGRGTLTRLTYDDAVEFSPVWHPDGRRLAFASDRNGTPSIYLIAADGTGGVQQLTDAGEADVHVPSAWSSDGRTLVFNYCPNASACDPAMVVVEEEGGSFQRLLETDFDEDTVSLSPDGRWIMYDSNESGQDQVFVRPFPDLGAGRWQISTDGGDLPTWRPDGKEIYFIGPAGMMSVAVESGESFIPGTPRLLFDLHDYGAEFGGYTVSPDGQRFLTNKLVDQDTGKTVIVLNWFDELERLVPTH